MLFIGYFEGTDNERGIEWCCADCLSLREFLGLSLTERVSDHSSLSRLRRRLPLEVQTGVFRFVLKVLVKERLLKGKNSGVEATTLETNAARCYIIRKDSRACYQEFPTVLAKSFGIEIPK